MKYVKYILVLFIIVVGLSAALSYIMKSNTPSFILNKLSELKDDDALMDSIGGFDHYEYSFNKDKFKTEDTLPYSILIVGKKRLLYKAIQVREGGEWKLMSDTLIIDRKN